MVDTLVLGASAVWRRGSSPLPRTFFAAAKSNRAKPVFSRARKSILKEDMLLNGRGRRIQRFWPQKLPYGQVLTFRDFALKNGEKRMPLKNGILLLIVAMFMFGCCTTTKELDEKYLIEIKTSEEVEQGTLTVHIAGIYGESAYGIDSLSLREVREGNALKIFGTVRFGSVEPIDLTIKVPSNVEEIYFCSKKIWARKVQ